MRRQRTDGEQEEVQSLVAVLLALALQQDQTPRQSAAFNRDFYELAASTGGDFYFWAPGEFASPNLKVPVHHEDVLLSYGSIDAERTFEFPVESAVKTLTVFAGMQRKDLAVLVRPDGTIQRDGVQSFQNMLIATVPSPPAGTWRLELHGRGPYAVTAHVDPGPDGVELISFEFVERGGRPGRAGEKLTCRVNVSGAMKDFRLVFVARDGAIIDSLSFRAAARNPGGGFGQSDRPDSSPSPRLGMTEPQFVPCVVPSAEYRAGISGTDTSGHAFARVLRPLRKPE